MDTLRNVARALPPSRFSQRLSWGLTLVIAFYVLWSVSTNKNFEWHVVYQWFNEKTVLEGLAVTLGL
ncbi:amino acid ABC transporter permease, partial [Candidatus Symbiopectobacterium sp. NZEC135]|nr:amino acid ABC transporter permease [Candidatus Symbiopectobacterium sp. NZEC135]